MGNVCLVHRLGLVPYDQAWKLQDRLAAQIARKERPATLLLLEHPHTYTFGRRGKAENLVWDDEEMTRRGVSVHWVDRGGDVTYHGPGQLVGYPLLPLSAPEKNHALTGESLRLPQADYVGYLRQIESMITTALARLEVASHPVEGLTGVWVDQLSASSPLHSIQGVTLLPAKIAAIGVKVDARGISRHGFALNVDPDMSYWGGIIGCGLKDYPVASLAGLLDRPPSMAVVMDNIVKAFGEVFNYETIEEPYTELASSI